MTAGTDLALRIPGDPGDPHVRAAASLLRRLAAAFPRAGLGLTGSVGTGTHGPASDLDLVMVDDSLQREAQFATVSEGIRAAVVCLRPEMSAEREAQWRLQAGGDVRIVSMVRSAVLVRDPAGLLGRMQQAVARLDAERRARRDEMMALRRESALAAVRGLHGGGASDAHLQLELFAAIVDGWFLRHGLAMDTRQETERMLETIAEHDPALSALLRAAVPLAHGSMAPLLRACDHVFGGAITAPTGKA